MTCRITHLFAALILLTGIARAEDVAPVYSLEVSFTPAGTEEKLTTVLPNLALEEDYNLTFPSPGMPSLTMEAQLAIYDTPSARFELYDPATKHFSAEGRASYTTLFEVTCPIVYGEETTVFENETGTLSFLLDGPGPKPEKPRQKPKPEPAASEAVPAEVLEQIEVDAIRPSSGTIYVQLYNPTERSLTLKKVKVFTSEGTLGRGFEVNITIDRLSSISTSFQGHLPDSSGKWKIEFEKAVYAD